MAKKHNELTIAQHAGLASRALARLETTARAVHENETLKRDRGVQVLSTREGFTAVIKHGHTMIEIEDDKFSVTQID